VQPRSSGTNTRSRSGKAVPQPSNFAIIVTEAWRPSRANTPVSLPAPHHRGNSSKNSTGCPAEPPQEKFKPPGPSRLLPGARMSEAWIAPQSFSLGRAQTRSLQTAAWPGSKNTCFKRGPLWPANPRSIRAKIRPIWANWVQKTRSTRRFSSDSPSPYDAAKTSRWLLPPQAEGFSRFRPDPALPEGFPIDENQS